MKVMLVTGGAGFIGSNFINYFLRRNKNYIIVNIDKLTYAGNHENLSSVEESPRYHFIKGDICNYELVNYALKRYRPDSIINFAAESHVDRSINNPMVFAETNILGTLTLLDNIRYIWGRNSYRYNRYIQISTDEVYGSLDNTKDYFSEDSGLLPNSPYSASKASADLMVRSFTKTYNIPAIITRCCNNYGPYQNAEKFLPTCITHALQDKPIPVYGDGSNIREWIHVLDHCTAIVKALFYGKPGEIYNIGSGEESTNIDLAKRVLKMVNKPESLIRMTSDRPGHDQRYAVNNYKAKCNLNWSCRYSLNEGLKETISWYESNSRWWGS